MCNSDNCEILVLVETRLIHMFVYNCFQLSELQFIGIDSAQTENDQLFSVLLHSKTDEMLWQSQDVLGNKLLKAIPFLHLGIPAKLIIRIFSYVYLKLFGRLLTTNSSQLCVFLAVSLIR